MQICTSDFEDLYFLCIENKDLVKSLCNCIHVIAFLGMLHSYLFPHCLFKPFRYIRVNVRFLVFLLLHLTASYHTA